MLAMAAHYDPDRVRFLACACRSISEPALVIPERWDNWLRTTPCGWRRRSCREPQRQAGASTSIAAARDQFHPCNIGARQLSKAWMLLTSPHVYEEFADDHSSVDYRMDVSPPFLESGALESCDRPS